MHAFYNVCRHRGTRMCEAASGNFGETIACPYHAWTYRLDGSLLGAPHMAGLAEFDKKDYPLHEAAVAEWEDSSSSTSRARRSRSRSPGERCLDRFTRFGLPGLQLHRRIEYDIAANWKLIHQNYSECYHCSPVHPQLVKLTPPTSGENDLYDGPFLGGYMDITAPGGSLTVSGGMCGVPLTDVAADAKQHASVLLDLSRTSCSACCRSTGSS